MKIEKIKLQDLKPLEKNVRHHNEKQINELVRSLNQFGQTRAIIVDEDNNILIGNGLYSAMVKRGDETAECSRITGLTENQKKKLVLSDNKVFSLGTDNYDNITAFLNDIALDGDFDVAGFDDEVLRSMMRELDEINTDVKNYGSVPENHIAPAAQPAEAKEHNTSNNENPPTQNFVQPENSTAQAAAAEVKHERTVICPSCGEVIHLD